MLTCGGRAFERQNGPKAIGPKCFPPKGLQPACQPAESPAAGQAPNWAPNARISGGEKFQQRQPVGTWQDPLLQGPSGWAPFVWGGASLFPGLHLLRLRPCQRRNWRLKLAASVEPVLSGQAPTREGSQPDDGASGAFAGQRRGFKIQPFGQRVEAVEWWPLMSETTWTRDISSSLNFPPPRQSLLLLPCPFHSRV